jgi:nicotinamide-nucleotide amidase
MVAYPAVEVVQHGRDPALEGLSRGHAYDRGMVSRAGIVVTGTEVLTGRVSDRNGPWLVEQLRLLGADIGEIVVVGDRPGDLRDALAFLTGPAAVDLVITSGGLGPTADDLTARAVGDFYGRPAQVDEQLLAHIGGIVDRLTAARGWRTDPEATAAAVRKQAMVPQGATVLAPVGTAPGLVVPPPDGRTGPPIVVLPGPPRELQGMWPAVIADPSVRTALGTPQPLHEDTMRLWNIPESELSETLRRHEHEFSGLEITTCLHDGELEVSTRYGGDAGPALGRLHDALAKAHPDELFSADGRTIDDIVADAFRSTGRTVATAESCTAGLLAGRLTDVPGSSDYVRGGLIAYSNEAKHDLAGVPTELIERVGAVSAEVAQALADGARERLGADIGVGITGVAGPGGGTPEKPVGLVHLCVSAPNRRIARRIDVPGTRSDVRRRSVLVAMHLLRSVLATAATDSSAPTASTGAQAAPTT